jgi:sterol desaturase/sphingolipid hydroxylase (fatty acid hydroxylase superfamily)
VILWASLAIIAIAAIVAEAIVRCGRGLGVSISESVLSGLLGIGNLVSRIAFQPLTLFLIVVTEPFSLFAESWSAGAVIVCFILNDLVGYWMHRFAHRTGWGWVDHIAHHTDKQFTYATSFRLGCLGSLTPAVLAPLPLIILGFPPDMIFAVHTAGALYQFFLHTEVVGAFPKPVEFVLNTPVHHRVHHAKDRDYLVD